MFCSQLKLNTANCFKATRDCQKYRITLTITSSTCINIRSGTAEEKKEEVNQLLQEAKEEYEEQKEVLESANGVKSSASELPRLMPNQNEEPGPLDVKCDNCEKIMAVKTYVSTHMESCLGQSMCLSRKCHWCDQVVSLLNLEKHAMKLHFVGKFSCLRCNTRTHLAEELVAHVSEAHGDDPGALCPSCKVEYSILDIEGHYKECITRKFREKRRKEDACNKTCETCGKSYTRKRAYAEHIKSHLREQAANGEESVTNLKLFRYCDQCDMKFATRTGLNTHRSRVHENAKFLCPSCPMIFDTMRKLIGHQNLVHSTEGFLCKYCGKRCRGRGERNAHEKIHELPRLKCKFCEKTLVGKESLETHEKYHTGEMNFQCSMCSKKFVSKKKLQQHERGAHKIAGPKGGKVGWEKKQK